MKILFPLTLAALVSFTLSAQTGPGYRSPRPTTANIGYEMAIEPRFEGICFDFSEGMAGVMEPNGAGWTCIGTDGKKAVSKSYRVIRPFRDGLAAVEENGKWGYINTRGEQVIPCKFTLAGPFSCGHAVVSEAEPEASGMITERGVIGHDGRYTIAQGRFSTILSAFSEDYIVVGSEDGKVGFANVNGKVVIPMVYEEARPFHEGYAAVKVGGKWGFLKLL